MQPPSHKRLFFFGGLALLLAALLIARWISHWGLVTIHVQNEPLGKVLASISRQGHVRVVTSLDTNKTIGLDVELVTPAYALNVVSDRMDANWRVAYLAAPSKAILENAIVSLQNGGKLPDWTTKFYPLPPVVGGGAVLDPRYLKLSLEGPDNQLPILLDQAAQKTGVMTIFPADWSPSVTALPSPSRTGKAIAKLVSSAHGKLAEIMLLTHQDWREWQADRRPPQQDGENRPQGGGDPFAGLNQSRMKPEWRQERVEAQIQQLPVEQQAAAKKDVDDMRATFEQLRNLPPDERRAKWQELMNNPDVVDRMENNRALRQQSQPAEQRIDRGISYLERRSSAQSGQSSQNR